MGDKPFDRRRMILGAAAVATGGLVSRPAQAFPRGADEAFKAASDILKPYGVKVRGNDGTPHDTITFKVQPVPNTEYRQAVHDERSGLLHAETSSYRDNANFVHYHPTGDGGILPCIKTSIRGDERAIHSIFDGGEINPCFVVDADMLEGGHIGDIEATHFHESATGEFIPCVRTTIEGHDRALHELFEVGEIAPCFVVASDMLDGGHIGDIEATHFHPTGTGDIVPCVRTTIQGHELAIHELFDGSDINPCFLVESEMLEGGHIGTITATHQHQNAAGAFIPCIRATIEDHALARYEILDAESGSSEASLEIATEMLEGGRIGAIDIAVNDSGADLSIRVGTHLYVLRGGVLVLLE